LVLLVEAWASIARCHGTAKLVVAGPDDRNHRAEVERVVAERGVGSHVEFTGFVSGEAKARLFATATCLVLPSATENFGNVVAEALAYGVPVIASTGTPWRGLLTHRCGWWVEPRLDAMAATLDEALSESVAGRVDRGLRGRRWMTDEFSWPSVARRMAEFYLSIVDRQPRGHR
jgi:glycosyltransferase involved in cell wall biosynthesis